MSRLDRFLEWIFPGSFTIGPLTVYGFNAMHLTVQLHTNRWGYVCLHPSVYHNGTWWRWKFYVSPNATPWASTFAIGPGLYRDDKEGAKKRLAVFGHNFNTDLLFCRPCDTKVEAGDACERCGMKPYVEVSQ